MDGPCQIPGFSRTPATIPKILHVQREQTGDGEAGRARLFAFVCSFCDLAFENFPLLLCESHTNRAERSVTDSAGVVGKTNDQTFFPTMNSPGQSFSLRFFLFHLCSPFSGPAPPFISPEPAMPEGRASVSAAVRNVSYAWAFLIQ